MSWLRVTEHYRDLLTRLNGKDGYGVSNKALAGLLEIGDYVATTPLENTLFGWTSVLDLCIQQTEAPPMSVPYLRIQPLGSGKLSFRFQDTPIEAKQWKRVLRAENGLTRFKLFLEQLRWVAAIP